MKIENISLWDWYLGVEDELKLIDFTKEESQYYISYYDEAGLLNAFKRPFFRQHYCRSFSVASKVLLSRTNPLIVDLGGGTGTQLIYLCLNGARGVCVDMDPIALRIFKKRILFYERKYNTKLNIKLICKSSFDVDYSKFGGIDGVYSMFAFNLMQPSEKMIKILLPHLNIGAKLVLIDGNTLNYAQSILKLKSRTRDWWSPLEYAEFLENHNFTIVNHHGGITFPPILWRIIPRQFIRPIDNYLSRFWFFPISHQICAEKF